MKPIENKVILITGASSGIGEASARLLAQHGGKVVLGARRGERLKAIVGDIRAAGGSAEYTEVEVTDAKSVDAFVAFAQERYGRIDVMFNNAGIMPLSFMRERKA